MSPGNGQRDTRWAKAKRDLSKLVAHSIEIYKAQPLWLTVIVIPAFLGVFGLVILRFSSGWSGLFQVASFALWTSIVLLQGVISALSTALSREKSAAHDANVTMINNMSAMNMSRKRKLFEAKGRGSNIRLEAVAKRARGAVSLDAALIGINKSLFDSISTFLDASGRLESKHILLVLLKPDDSGKLVPYVEQIASSGYTRIVTGETGLRIDDQETLCGRLWESKVRSMSIGNTEEAAKNEQFAFINQTDPENLKSIYCFKIVRPDDPQKSEPFAIWSVESDKVNALPDQKEEKIASQLNQIFSAHESLLHVELAFDEVLRTIEPYILGNISKVRE